MVSDLQSLKEAVVSFAASCANKLRGQRSVAGCVSVFVASNRFREDLSQYSNCQTSYFEVKTSDTLEITQMALQLLESMFVTGIWYKRAGVIVGGIESDRCVCQSLFDGIHNRPQRHQLMMTLDSLNQRFGINTIHLAAEGDDKSLWKVKCEHKSQNYLTDINELLTINV